MKNVIIALGVVGVAWSGFAADPDVSKLPPPSAKKGLTYEKDIKSIVEKNCIKCHGPEKQKGKYRTDSLEAIIKGGDGSKDSGIPAIVAGKSEKSPMVHYIGYLVEDSEMPPKDKDGKSKKLSDEEIGLIRAWIDQGAK
jgi:mono/diheme cytochrome c family protein